MKRLATFALVPLFAVYLCAQTNQSSQSQSETTTTTWNGTLVDAGCRTTHTEHKESTSDQNSTTTKTQTSNETECPVTTSTTTFGLLTPDGQFVRFDEPSNTKVVEMVKSNKKWNSYMSDRKPIKVRVIGTPNGDVVVVRSIEE